MLPLSSSSGFSCQHLAHDLTQQVRRVDAGIKQDELYRAPQLEVGLPSDLNRHHDHPNASPTHGVPFSLMTVTQGLEALPPSSLCFSSA